MSDLPHTFNQEKSKPAKLGNLKIGSLFWADDIVILSETKTGLQSSLDELEQYCSKNEMKVNVEKTKCMIFNKGGRTMKSVKFFYDKKEIETVSCFSYLGFMLTPSFSIKKLLDDLYKRGLKAYFKLRNCLGKTFRSHITLAIDLFDALVKPILTYGIDFWGCLKQAFSDMNPIEKLNIKLCKHILGVTKSTSNVGCRCELGRNQLYISNFKRNIKNWMRILHDPINDILEMTYKENMTQGLTWTKNLQNILTTHGLGDIWEYTHLNKLDHLSRTHTVNKIFQRVVDISVQNTLTTLQKQPKMRTYCLFRKDVKLERYLTEINSSNTRTFLSKFRLSDHKLEIETGRYHRPKKTPEQRLCQNCGTIEDEIHCLITCKINSSEREQTVARISIQDKTFYHFDEATKFTYLLQNDNLCDQNIYSFIVKCLENSYAAKL